MKSVYFKELNGSRRQLDVRKVNRSQLYLHLWLNGLFPRAYRLPQAKRQGKRIHIHRDFPASEIALIGSLGRAMFSVRNERIDATESGE